LHYFCVSIIVKPRTPLILPTFLSKLVSLTSNLRFLSKLYSNHKQFFILMNFLFKKSHIGLLLLFVILFLDACKKDPIDSTPTTVNGAAAKEFDSSVLNGWYAHTLDLIKTTNGYTPPVASRTLGYIGVTVYESLLPGMPDSKSLAGQLNGLTALPSPEFGKEYYMPAIANAALANINTKMFPATNAKKAKFDSIKVVKEYYEAQFRSKNISQEIVTRSAAYGNAIAEAIYLWETGDVIGHEAYNKNFPASYTVPTGPGFWEPTGAQLIPLQPFWGNARCFIPKSVPEAQPVSPPKYSTSVNSDFYNYATQVFNAVKNTTPTNKLIALYWADGGGTVTPPGHSIAITKQLIEEKGLTLDKAAETYAKVGLAVADAFMACWKCKYDYNLMRPETYIKKNIDPNWKPLIATPPFPEYVSGHSTQSGATAYVLNSIFGTNTPFVDKTNQGRKDIDGTPRSYKSFDEMAAEAAISRLYGGIHYEFGNKFGLDAGTKIGKALDKVNFRK
jgi:PAP2 superfamily